MFIDVGGDSLKAVLFIDILESELIATYPGLISNKILDVLLSKKFRDLTGYIKNEINDQTKEGSNSFSVSKFIKIIILLPILPIRYVSHI